MKRWLLCLLFTLVCVTRSEATWSLVQAKSNNGCTTTSCAITVTATGTGNTIVLFIAATAAQTISSVSGGGTYTLCGTNCQKGNATSGFTDMAYTLSSTSGATTITMTLANGAPNEVAVMWELSTTSGPGIFDTSNSVLDSVNCTSCAGVGLTPGGSNDAIVTGASCGGTCSAVTTYTADLTFPGGDGAAHLLNTASGTAPSWTQSPTSNLASAAIAIKETGGGGGSAPAINKSKKLEQLEGGGKRL